MVCLSCNNEHQSKYCPICGEKNGVKKITLASILEDTFLSVVNMDKGFFFNLKTLILAPKKIITDYILGKRKGILNPVSFLIFSVTIYLLVISFLKIPKETVDIVEAPKNSLHSITYETGQFIRAYLKYFWILSIIPMGFSTWLVFRKHNYIEHLAVSSFIVGQATLLGVISYLILRVPLIFDPLVYLCISWLVYKVFKRGDDKFESALLSFLTLVLFVIQLFVIVVAIIFFKA